MEERLKEEAVQYLDALYRTAVRLTHNAADAEDLVQETYVRALGALDQFEQGTNLRAWLFRILMNTFINHYRRRQRQPLATSLDAMSDFTLHQHRADPQQHLPEEQPEQAVLDQLAVEEVLRAIDALPLEFRQVVWLADVEGFRYREIADILKIPIGTVMSRLHRARRRLQEVLAPAAAQPCGCCGE